MTEEITVRQKILAIYKVAKYRPLFTVGVGCLSVVAAILEGVGLGFLFPIIEYARGTASSDPGGLNALFIGAYDVLGITFTLKNIVLGVGIVMTFRYLSSFIVAWLMVALQKGYLGYLRTQSFRGALDAKVAYFDEEGSDDILNAIITQTNYASAGIRRLVKFLEISLVCFVYFAIALYLAPYLTVMAVFILAAATFVTQNTFESGFSVGDDVAEANEHIQQVVQAGTQGIRDVKLFGMVPELYSNFNEWIDKFVDASVRQGRNSEGINNIHQLISALSVFFFIYLGIEYASLTIGGLGVFLFAMFRLSPRVSTLNKTYYQADADLAHLVRAQEFIEDLESKTEPNGSQPARENVTRIRFDDVSFGYDDSNQTLRDVSFEADAGEFVAFVGESGAGKSTIVSLLARMYEPDSGEIRANGTPIDGFKIVDWRDKISVVRQTPFIFNDTLRKNITVGNRNVTQDEIEQVVEIAEVDEFLDEMPDGYDTVIGDNGIRLSGGQKQRVALARALLEDADVLVLDEATSDLDTNIESRVQYAIESMDREYIMITVAHRLSTVKNADRIYTVEDGEIIDVGPHEELIAENGKYAELYSE